MKFVSQRFTGGGWHPYLQGTKRRQIGQADVIFHKFSTKRRLCPFGFC
jgi:hypothetical protein